MDENPDTEISKEDLDDIAFRAAMALTNIVMGDKVDARHWIARIPRAHRGRIKIALDDLDMMISRMGKDATG